MAPIIKQNKQNKTAKQNKRKQQQQKGVFQSFDDTFRTLFFFVRLAAGTCKTSVSETYLTDFIFFMARVTMTTILLKKANKQTVTKQILKVLAREDTLLQTHCCS